MAHILIKKLNIIDSSVNLINASISNIYSKNYIDSNIYYKSYIDSSFSQVYTKTQVDSSLVNYYNKSYIDSSYNYIYSRTGSDISLNNYYSKNYIDSSLSQVYTKTQIDSSFVNYYNKSYIDASYSSLNNNISLVNQSLSNIYTKSYIDSSFSQVYTKTQVDSSFANYYTKSYIDSSLSQVYTKTQVDSSFANYYNKSYMDASFANVYTKAEANSRFTLSNLLLDSQYDETLDISINNIRVNMDASFSEIKNYINTNFYNNNYVDASFVRKTYFDSSMNSYYSKNYIDSSFSQVYTKTQVDTSLNNYATKVYLDSSLNSNYSLKTYLDTSLNNYATKTYVDSSLNSNYVLKSYVDSSFSQVYTKAQVDTSLNNYATKVYLDSSLNSNYTLKTYLDTSLNNYALKSYVDGSLNSNYALKTYVDSSLNSNYALKTYVDTSINNIKTKMQSAMNYAQTKGSIVTVSNANLSNSTVVSVSITTTGSPVLVMVSGDANPLSAGGWVVMNLFRDGTTAIGNSVNAEGSAANENNPYLLQAIDAPPAGTYTYSMKTVGGSSASGVGFGEGAGPVITAIELAGTTGPAANDALIQNGIIISATTTAPTTGTRGIDKIEYQYLANRIRLTYRLSYAAGTAGTGEYLINLPTGIKFNTTYDPTYTGGAWNTIASFGQYLIPVSGGNINSSLWPLQSYIVPYDNNGAGGTGRFRVITTTQTNTYGFAFWASSTHYPISAEGSWVVTFDIWA